MNYFKLSSAQQKVVLLMFTEDYYMVNNEGRDFKVWLEDKSLTKRGTLNRNTGEYLHREGWVSPAVNVGRVSSRLFYDVLSEKAIKHLQYLVSVGKLNPYK